MRITMDDLLDRARGRDKEAEKQLLERLRVRFAVFAGHRIREKEDAEDAVQAALTIVSQKYKTMNFEKSFESWAYGILINMIKRHFEKKRRENEVFDRMSEFEEQSIANSTCWDPVELMTLIECLRQIFKRNRRYALTLKYKRKGYDVTYICKRLRIKRNHFYVVLNRARAMLESCMEGGQI
jgi:RNA polymerase sigma factor (sigma-70 family)